MNIMIWLFAGAIAGWVSLSYMKLNEDRGMIVSIIIGMVGGLLGGNVLAPMLGAAMETPNDFNLFALGVALASAGGCLIAGNLLSTRYGV